MIVGEKIKIQPMSYANKLNKVIISSFMATNIQKFELIDDNFTAIINVITVILIE